MRSIVPDKRFDAAAFLMASLAAPATSFVLWSGWALATEGPGPSGLIDTVIGGTLFLVLFTAWGALPAAAFGAVVLLPLERFWPRQPAVWVLVPAGLVAAGAYVAVSLRLMDLPGVILFAPWVAGRLGTEDMTGHPLAPIATCIVLSGALAALVYARAAGRVPTPRPRSSSEP